MTAITKLPFQASNKMATLCDMLEETHARLLANQRRLKSMEDQQRHVGELEPDVFEEIAREIARVNERREADDASYRHLSRLVTALRNWILQLPASAEISDAPAPKAEILNSDTVDQGVIKCREELAKQKHRRALIARAVPPLDDLYAEVASHVGALARRGRPSVTIVNGQLVVRPSNAEQVGGNIGSPRNHESTLALAAWLHSDVVMERLREQVEETHAADVRRGIPVLTTADRDEKLALLDAEMLGIERLEEFYITVGAQYGLVIERRDDADPQAVLGVLVRRPQRQQRAA